MAETTACGAETCAATFTRLISAAGAGDPRAAACLMSPSMTNFALSGKRMPRERPDHTLQVTALIHEAYLRLVDVTGVPDLGQPLALLRRRR